MRSQQVVQLCNPAWQRLGRQALVLQVRRVYLIEITDTQPHQLNLERVWVLDSDTRTLARAQVEHRAKLDDPREWTLRIM